MRSALRRTKPRLSTIFMLRSTPEIQKGLRRSQRPFSSKSTPLDSPRGDAHHRALKSDEMKETGVARACLQHGAQGTTSIWWVHDLATRPGAIFWRRSTCSFPTYMGVHARSSSRANHQTQDPRGDCWMRAHHLDRGTTKHLLLSRELHRADTTPHISSQAAEGRDARVCGRALSVHRTVPGDPPSLRRPKPGLPGT